jgi:hypothetical protein
MSTLHIVRTEPDERVRELIQAVTPGEIKTIAVYEDLTNYDDLVDEIFSHDHIISWW